MRVFTTCVIRMLPSHPVWVLAVRKRNLIWLECRAEDKFLHFFALHLTTGLKIPGAVILLNVFTQPGSLPHR